MNYNPDILVPELSAPRIKPRADSRFRLNANHPLAKGLMALWLFNEGGGINIYDHSLNSQHGVLNNTEPVSWLERKEGYQFEFKIPNPRDYMEVAGFPDISDVSLAVWIEVNSTGLAFRNIMGRTGNSNWNNGYALYYTGDNKFHFWAAGTYNGHDAVSESVFNAGQLYHVVGTHDGTTNRIYVDGVEGVSSSAGSASKNVGTFFLGGNLGSYSSTMDGKIIAASVYNRSLSRDEIIELYKNPYQMLVPEWSPYIIAAGVTPETGLLTVGANAGLTVGGLAGGLGSLAMAAEAGESMGALAAAKGALTAAAEAGESMSALAAAVAEMDAGAVAGEAMAALAAAAAAVVAGAEAGDIWTTGATGQLTVGAQASESFAAAAAAYGALTGATTASEAISATAAALASLAIDAEAGDTFLPDSSAEGGVVLRGAIRLQAALRGEIDIKPLLRGLPSTRPH